MLFTEVYRFIPVQSRYLQCFIWIQILTQLVYMFVHSNPHSLIVTNSFQLYNTSRVLHPILQAFNFSNMSQPSQSGGFHHSHGAAPKWMVFVRENPIYQWMMTGGTPISGNHPKWCGISSTEDARRAATRSRARSTGNDWEPGATTFFFVPITRDWKTQTCQTMTCRDAGNGDFPWLC